MKMQRFPGEKKRQKMKSSAKRSSNPISVMNFRLNISNFKVSLFFKEEFFIEEELGIKNTFSFTTSWMLPDI